MAVYQVDKTALVNIYNKIGKHFNINVDNVTVDKEFIDRVQNKMQEIIHYNYPITKKTVSFTDIKEIYERMNSEQY